VEVKHNAVVDNLNLEAKKVVQVDET